MGDATAAGAGTTQARFNAPRGIAAADAGTLYVTDSSNHRIRRVTIGATAAATQVSDFAGSGTQGHANATGTAAQFNNPVGIAIGGTTLYVSEAGNQRIRAIDIATKTVRTIAGDGTSGTKNRLGSAARFQRPTGIVVSAGTLYVTTINAGLIRKLEYREVD